jgi:gamma-glutamyltranspeptidase/glutathione hydrolase
MIKGASDRSTGSDNHGSIADPYSMTQLSEPKEAAAKRGVVATAFPSATQAGLEILQAGGNAIDAAVAAAWALAVCEPSGSGLGGSTILLFHSPAGRTVVINGQSYAPAAVSKATVTRGQQTKGYRACTIPSTVATLGVAQTRYGLLPPGRVMEPAIRLAQEGYPITRLQRRQQRWSLADLSAQPEARRLFLQEGRPFRIGDIFRQPQLAATLRRLAGVGTEDFYRGQIARDIAEDMARNGGLMTQEDLAGSAEPTEVEPLAIRYRDARVLSTALPSGGTPLLIALKILEQFPLKDLSGEADDWYEIVAETSHAVFHDPDHLAAPPCRLTPSFYDWLFSSQRIKEITKSMRTPCGESTARPAPEGPGETTHLCTADAQGHIVSLTQSIQSVFGAKVANGKLGFLYNNYLCTSPRRRHPYQLQGRGIPRTNAAPTLVLRGDASGPQPPGGPPAPRQRPFLALGAAGSRRITSAILQVISGVLDRGLPLVQAVASPRVHATLGRRVHVEKPAATESLLGRLEKRFRAVQIRSARSFFMGAVQAIQWNEDGSFVGAADPRRDGTAALW